MADNNLDCPVDFIIIDENRARMVAFLVLILGIICWVQLNWGVAIFLMVDFGLRAFKLNAYSPLGFLAGKLTTLFHIKNKPTDRAPKRFAALMGLIFSGIIFLTLVTGLLTIAQIMLFILLVCAGLESLLGICIGCYVYTYLKKLGFIKQ
ncbi:DUF4395 domain-containing protein [Mucilaginibacter sp. dw_454]|uniref:DUF4395 domain-containing protein n=1 Tax=Mucilaginibacter sp. dw_454 TaxID=2720079 RepID=UPI001BD36CDE|nr:DUF4395 domain-containing protein [Mucilaginibacter sp. dw_454]